MTGGARLGPWQDSDVVMVCLTALVGVAGILAAWFGADRAGSLTQQALWAYVAVAGFVVSGVGMSLWLMRGRRTIGERRVSLVSLEASEDEHVVTAPRPWQRTESLTLVRAPGMRRMHDPGCPLVAGKDVEAGTLADGEPCAVCVP